MAASKGFTRGGGVATPRAAMSAQPAPVTTRPGGLVPGRRMGVPYLVLGLMLLATLGASVRVRRAVEEQERARFIELAQSAYQALAASVEYDLNAVRSL